jgi:hypothetical protein
VVTDECVRLDDSKSVSPRKEFGKQYQGQRQLPWVAEARLGTSDTGLTVCEGKDSRRPEYRLKATSDEPQAIEQ